MFLFIPGYGRKIWGSMASRKYENLKLKKNSIIHDTKKDLSKFDKVADEAKRVSGMAKSVTVIISDLNRGFEQATKFTKVDIRFLFFAMCQTVYHNIICRTDYG